jgi:hypothetical protein
LINKVNLWISRQAYALESQLGLVPAALISGGFILLLSCLYVWPKTALEYHGTGYAELSKHIFDPHHENELRYRVLSPFIGWITFMKGNRFPVIPWTFLLLFLSATYYEFRRMQLQPATAFLAAALMGFSCTSFLPLRSPGYVDPASYFLILLIFTRIQNTPMVTTLLALALLNHESIIFLLPSIIGFHYLSLHNKFSNPGPPALKTLGFSLTLGLAFIPFLAYRYWVHQHQAVHLSLSYYLSRENIQECLNVTMTYAPMAAFYAFRLFWFFPLWAAWKNRTDARWKSLWYLFTLSMIGAQLIIAFDTTRLFVIAFPLILIGLKDLIAWYGERMILRKGWQLFVLNLFILPYFVGRDEVFHLHSGIYRLFLWLIQEWS